MIDDLVAWYEHLPSAVALLCHNIAAVQPCIVSCSHTVMHSCDREIVPSCSRAVVCAVSCSRAVVQSCTVVKSCSHAGVQACSRAVEDGMAVVCRLTVTVR